MADIEEKLGLDIREFLTNLDKVDHRLGDTMARMKEVAKMDPLRDAARASVQAKAKMEKELITSLDTYVKVTNSAKAYEAELKRLTKEKERLNKAQKEFIAAGKYDKYQKELKRVNDRIKEVNASLGKTPGFASKFGGAVSKLSGGLLSSTTALLGGVAAGLLAIGKKAFDAQAGFQGFQAQLSVGLGSMELANTNLTVLEDLARKLPGSLDVLTDSYARLVNRGFKPTKEELINLSGLAASQNKEFSQLAEAILDAEGGELERLKEFGIQAKNVGDKVIISFNGVTKEFTKNARESAKAFSELSKEAGLDKLNDAKMKTLDGRLSNLGDTVERIFRLLGKFLIPAFEFLFDVVEKGLEYIDGAVTGFGLLGDKMTDNKQKIDKQVYPAFQRLFDLFKPEGDTLRDIKIFFLGVSAGWDKIANMVSLAVSEVEYFLKIMGNVGKLGTGFGLDDLRKANQEAREQLERDRIQFNKNRRNIGRSTGRALAEILNPTRPGELEYDEDPNKKKPKKELTPEEKAARKKAEEARKKRLEDEKKALEKAQKDLQDKLLELQKQYGQDRLEALQKDKLAYLAEKKRLDLLEIDEEEKTLLKLKQIAAGAQKGRFDKEGNPIADTSVRLTDAERAPLNFRREAVTQREYAERAEYEAEQQRQLTRELSNEYQRQLQDVEEKYEELYKLTVNNENTLARLRIRKQQEVADILLQQELDSIGNSEKQELLAAEIELYDAQAKGRIDLETEVTKKLLEIEKKYLQARLTAIVASGVEVNDERVTELIAKLAALDAQIKKTQKTAEKSNDLRSVLKRLYFKSQGVTKEQLNDPDYKNPELDNSFDNLEAYAVQFGSVMQELFSVQEEFTRRRIELIDKEIEAKKAQIEKDRELNEKGYANNLDLHEKELAELKKQRERAAKDQQRLQRAQIVADSAVQVSNMITAVTGIFSSNTKLGPFGIGLALASMALMFGAFAAAKVKAFQLTKQAPVFEKGGPHFGRRHSEGGELVEVEGGEYTVNRRSTAKYYDLIEAINENDSMAVIHHAMKELKAGANNPAPQQQRLADLKQMRAYNAAIAQQKSNDTALLERIEARLQTIEGSTGRIPETQLVPLGDGQYMEKGPDATVIRDVKGMMGK